MSIDKTSDASSASASLSVGDFLRFLETEIDRITTQQREPGWTVLAILLALAGLAWLISEELISQSFRVDTVARLFVAAASAIACLEVLASPFFARSDDGLSQGSRFARARSLFGHSGLALAGGVLYCALLASLAWYFRANTPGFFVYLAVGTYGGAALVFLISPILGSSGMPSERPHPPVYRSFALIPICGLLSLALGLIAVGFLAALIAAAGWPPIAEIRLSIMLAVAASLLMGLLHSSSPPPLLDTLIAIRRELALGRSSLAEAIRKADIVFLGLKATDVLQEEVKSVLELLTCMNREVREGIEALDLISARLPLSDDHVSPTDNDSLKVFLGGAQARQKSALEKERETRSTLERLKQRIEWTILRAADRPRDTLIALISMIEGLKAEWFRELEEFTAKFEDLRKRAESLDVVLDSRIGIDTPAPTPPLGPF